MSLQGQYPMARFVQYENNNVQATKWQGDEIVGLKDSDTVRLMFHNVNGLSLSGHFGIDMFVNEQLTLDVDQFNHYWPSIRVKSQRSIRINQGEQASLC